MAWLEEHPTSGHFKICSRWAGKKHKKTLKTTGRKDAESVLTRFEENIGLLERGRLELLPMPMSRRFSSPTENCTSHRNSRPRRQS